MKKQGDLKNDEGNFKKDEAKLAAERKKRKKFKKAAIVLGCLAVAPAIVFAVAIAGFAVWAKNKTPDRDKLPSASAVATFYDADGVALPGKIDPYIDESELFDNLVYAFVAVEDKRFFEHKGYDAVRIGGAILSNLKERKITEGASTITQQLIKNTHLSNERTFKRKLNELALAANLEKQYSKRQILSMYLSVIYFGKGCYGVKEAAKRYFGKTIGCLSLAECATLAGIVKNPAKYSPETRPDESVKRRNLVLQLMFEQGYISNAELEEAKNCPLVVKNEYDGVRAEDISFYLKKAEEEVLTALGITKYQLDNSGIKIYTNLQADLQRELEANRLDSANFEREGEYSVAVAIDNKKGAVIGISSSAGYDVFRQAGSALKPLAVYAPAFDRRLVTLATPIVDEKINYAGFAPSNFGDVYYGETTVREAIKKSMNSVSVKLMDYLGSDVSAQYLENFGITVGENDKNYALALGATAKGVNPVKLANAYCALANGGIYKSASFVRYIVKDGQKIVLNGESAGAGENRAVSEAAAALTTIALVDTVKTGTAKTLSTLPFAVAAKTGTAQRADGKNSDAWLASYNPDYTVLVWHGSDDGFGEKGGGYPAMHATKIWRWLFENKTLSAAFEKSEQVVGVDVDTYSSSKCGCTVAANENTPLEYRKFEYFDVQNCPDDAVSMFGEPVAPEFFASVENGVVKINFSTIGIYDYELYRKDILGTAQIFAISGDGNCVELKDVPITLGGAVEYTLRAKLKNKPQLYADGKKLLFVDMPI